jgi:formylmethanofuran dehydrogenase subunit B
MPASQVIHDFVCTACGCACDDLTVETDGARIVAFAPPCPLAASFLLAERPAAAPTTDTTALIDEAARLLRAAKAPLIMGFERTTVEAQRLAVEIADRLGAVIDPTDARGASCSHASVQNAGAVTATLGEVASRSDLVIYWECDPASTHPRHMERFAGREQQRTLVVDHWPSPSASLADDYMLIPTHSGPECLVTLRALVRGIAVDAETVEHQTGNSVEVWRRLAERLKAAKYPTIFTGDASSQAITELVRDLHRHTRAVALPLGGAPNAVGAAQVLTWQTGFPAAVRFSRGYPEYFPDEATAARLLARGEVDAALIVAADPLPHLALGAASHLRAIPTIVLDDRDTATRQAATVAIPVAPFGLAEEGSVFRADGVVLPLRAAIASPAPTTEHVLRELAARLIDYGDDIKTPSP